MVDIFQAIIDGDIATVKIALSEGADPNMTGKDGLELVHYAAMANQPQIFDLLISKGAYVDSKDNHNNTALYFAARAGGSKDFIQSILNAGAQINNQNKLGQTATHISARIGNVDAMETLLKNGANPNIKDIVGKTPLLDAIKTGHPEVILSLLEHRADVNIKDNYNNTPMLAGFNSTNPAINEIFHLPILNKLAIPAGNTLFEAVVAGEIQGVKDAIANGGLINSVNQYGLTPFHFATLHGDIEMMDTLAKLGASIIRTDVEIGFQAIHVAAMTHDVSVLDKLLSLNASINASDKLGNSPLHYACQHADSTAIVQKILDAGALINTQNNKGETALHLAAADGNLDVVKLLVAHNANAELKDMQNETPLQEAIKTHHQDVATFLTKDGLQQANSEFNSLKPMVKETPLVLSDIVTSEKSGIPGLGHTEHLGTIQPSAVLDSIVVSNEVVHIAPVVETL